MASVPGSEASDVVVVLTEAALSAADVEHVLDIYRDPDGDGVPDPVAFRVLVPGETERHVLTTLLEHLGAGELRQAWDDLTGGRPDPQQAAAAASEKLATSVAGLRAVGVPVDGEVIDDDPLPALRAAVTAGDVREIVVVTYPHPVKDTFHSDWASRARDTLKVPVLHLYAGTSELG
ncbi:hypothetical protein Xcel_1885 [Xylanimonas cellulosilytica DSM 15894]|uniref:Uncharacterized protein n=1 Tax=Xylanimonas cellulosilytica (strain DSM 15894 / JCM 12276 / CECT 5975 / KCTC 9989 / LMG 20990 / NBRC 107835 / XIL07) TaxID=446471 RepID=D1BT62_XYLCX|nr:hypothetical protein [Xylanimonas cellulosilytica]ACZ30904.1 hypothetical protein Xcel_1885 [Xylanimonas cellulosilytica DSM 15894]